MSQNRNGAGFLLPSSPSPTDEVHLFQCNQGHSYQSRNGRCPLCGEQGTVCPTNIQKSMFTRAHSAPQVLGGQSIRNEDKFHG